MPVCRSVTDVDSLGYQRSTDPTDDGTRRRSVERVKTYQELLAAYHEARSRADRARAEWDKHLPTEGVRLTTQPEMRAAYEEVVAATEAESTARTALIDYRGE